MGCGSSATAVEVNTAKQETQTQPAGGAGGAAANAKPKPVATEPKPDKPAAAATTNTAASANIPGGVNGNSGGAAGGAAGSEEVKTTESGQIVPPSGAASGASAGANTAAGAMTYNPGTGSTTTTPAASGFSLDSVIEVAAPAELTWQVVGDWLLNYLKGYSTDIKVTHRDDGLAKVRVVEIPKVGTVEEKLLSLNNEKRIVSYIMTQTATLPYKDYSVELRVESAGAASSQVIWHSAAASSIGDPLIAKEKAQEGLNGAVYVMRNAVKALVDAAATAK